MPIRMVKKNKEIEEQEPQEEKMTIEEIHEQQDRELLNNTPAGEYYFIKFSYDFIYKFFLFVYKTIRIIIKVSGVYLLWICLHYIASHLYIKFCVPTTIIGFLMSPFMTATPHCQGLRWIVYNAANMINNMWIVLGAWICSTILITNNNNSPENSS